MKTVFSVFVGLSVLGIFLLVWVYKRYSKKKLSLISGIAMVLGYGICCLFALLVLINNHRPEALRKIKIVQRFMHRERQGLS